MSSIKPEVFFLLKSLYDDRKVEQSYILCVRGIDFASVFDFYILIWNFLHDRGELLTLFLQFSDWIGEMVRQRGMFSLHFNSFTFQIYHDIHILPCK